jgi:hypothetical protein
MLTTKQTELLLLMALALEKLLRKYDQRDYIAFESEQKRKEVLAELRDPD